VNTDTKTLSREERTILARFATRACKGTRKLLTTGTFAVL
jgi:hypothetical protein